MEWRVLSSLQFWEGKMQVGGRGGGRAVLCLGNAWGWWTETKMQIYPRTSNLIHFWEFIHEPAIPLIIHTTSPSRRLCHILLSFHTLPYLAHLPYFAISCHTLHYFAIYCCIAILCNTSASCHTYHILPYLAIPQHGSPIFVHLRSRLCHLTPCDMESSQKIRYHKINIFNQVCWSSRQIYCFPYPPPCAVLVCRLQARLGWGRVRAPLTWLDGMRLGEGPAVHCTLRWAS